MNADAKPSVMRRKAGAGRPPPEIGALTPARALQSAIAQAAQDVAGLDAAATVPEPHRRPLTPMVEAVPEQALISLIEGPAGSYGLMVLDPQSLAALIEVQTTGRVVPRPATPRPPTRTDAIMCADFIDRVLEELETRIATAGLEDQALFEGFRYAMPLSEPRDIALALEEGPYRVFEVAVDYGRGAKSGQITLALPFDPPGHGHGAAPDAASFNAALQAQVRASPAQLAAILARQEMTLEALSRLEIGQTIALPPEALDDVALEDVLGNVVARGRLGQSGGMRALRLRIVSDGSDVGEMGAPAAAPPPGPRHLLQPGASAAKPPAAGAPEAEAMASLAAE